MRLKGRESAGSKPDLIGSGIAAISTLAIMLLVRLADPNLHFWLIMPPSAIAGVAVAIGIRRMRR